MPIMSDANIITILKDLLYDSRSLAFQKFIEKLVSRNIYDTNIPQYRIYNTITNNYITSFDQFVDNISNIYADFYYAGKADISNNTPHPFYILLSNYEIRLTKLSKEDSLYFNLFGGEEIKKISFICNYNHNNADSVFRLIEVMLVNG